MEKELNIREASVADALAIAELSRQLGHPITNEEAQERIEKISQEKDQKIFVAESSGKSVVGYVNVVAFFELLSGVQGRIWGLVVEEKARGTGVGKKLMEKAEVWAKRRGSKMMKVNSNVTRADTHTFYEKIGYSRYKEQAIFKKIL